MKIQPAFKLTARRAGGLFLGLRLHFPCSLVEYDRSPAVHWRRIDISVGLIFWTLYTSIDYGHHTQDDGC